MVQITSAALFCLLLAPSLAVPISNSQELHARAEDLVERNWFKSIFRTVKKVATPSNIGKVASFVIRDDESQLAERDLEELTDREFADLMERNWFKSAFRSIKKIATPSNIGKVASFVIRDDDSLLTERDLEELTERDIEELIKRNWFKSAFRSVKKIATPSNIGKVAGFVLREDAEELSQRDLEYLEDLSTREPSVGSFFRKIKNFFKPSNIDKAADTAKTISNLVREDVEDLVERDVDSEELSTRELEELEDLAARDLTFGSIFRNLVSREDGSVFERDYKMEDLD
ncbi:hypothetical protein M413DRAFT_440486 [Hebeloma cylindrosporum]|uniref:Uncharacterized protein n=1 Tax=Hebeloma cylindrosporum TaxID=76867 RepID=A0A0C3CSM9_HEBCY|nr:hypothetical protein M413DRAFT_440486 [Hebeloma cylindrosporum h7]